MDVLHQQAPVAQLATNVSSFLWSRAARPLRFAFTGSLAALAQLALLDTLTARRWQPMPAEAVAVVVSTEINFALSYLVTWYDRRPRAGSPRFILGRWAAYHASVAGALVINVLVFAATRSTVHLLAASALGTAVGAILNFFSGDRLVFRLEPRSSAPGDANDLAARPTGHPARMTEAGHS
jgi:putative flippase GtrA